MAKSITFDNDFLKLIFNATPIANIADNAATASLTNLFVALHTADPSTTAGAGTLGAQNASEISYTGYSRVGVARSTAGFTVTNNSASPTATISFGQMTAGTGGTATYFSVGVATTGATKILYSGTISPTISVANGVTPQITSASTITES